MKDLQLKLKELTLPQDRALGVADERGVIIVASDEQIIGDGMPRFVHFSHPDIQSFAGDHYRVVDRPSGTIDLFC